MKKLQEIINPVTQQINPSANASRTPAGQTTSNSNNSSSQEQQAPKADMIAAITYLFGAFELAYHNQFRRAFGDMDSQNSAKKLWAMQLARFKPEQIKRATDQAIQTNKFMPSLPEIVQMCEHDLSEFGLPDDYSAYVEACRANSPKENFSWSHPAVYWAGRSTGWFLLQSEPEQKVLPIFKKNYEKLCRKIRDGETLELPVHNDVPKLTSIPLPKEDQIKHIERVRKLTGL